MHEFHAQIYIPINLPPLITLRINNYFNITLNTKTSMLHSPNIDHLTVNNLMSNDKQIEKSLLDFLQYQNTWQVSDKRNINTNNTVQLRVSICFCQ